MRLLVTIAIASGLAILSSSLLVTEAMANTHEQAESAKTSQTVQSGFLMPYIDPARGRKLFASKGCVVCHSINGVGGDDAPSLVSDDDLPAVNPFEFAASMWRGASTMIPMQEDELGEQIEFTGNELADIIAFIHTREEQQKFSEDDIPSRIKKLMGHLVDENDDHEQKEHDG